MGLRFTRRITIFPGVRLNFSKNGVSLSVGPRGSSITFGKRGTFGNVGLPGTGLHYRKRLDTPTSGRSSDMLPDTTKPIEPVSQGDAPIDYDPDLPMHVTMLQHVLRSRGKTAIDWQERALWLAEAAPDEDDHDAFDQHARRIAQARFARRVIEGDRAAWGEALQDEVSSVGAPFGCDVEWQVEEGADQVRAGVELPDPEWPEALRLPIMKGREWYEDACCSVMLRLAYEIFRVVPYATDVHLTGYRSGRSPATGKLVRDILLRLATDRDSIKNLELDHVDPSTSFEGLGGAKKTKRGELQPIATEPHPASMEGVLAKVRSDAKALPASLPCPCEHVTHSTFGELQRDPYVECLGCGREITAGLAATERELQETEEEIRREWEEVLGEG